MRHRRTLIPALLVVCSIARALAGRRRAAVTFVGHSGRGARRPGRSTSTPPDVKELMKLDGVGRQVAEKIVEYRDAHGPFKKPEELRKVEGVGNGLWERNRTRIVIK